MKTRRTGLTVIEILVVVGIIALLVGMLLPAVHTVRKMAQETKQRAQFTSIDLGLVAFKNDYGDYPPSHWWDPRAGGTGPQNYCGAQKLAEALAGWDLLGFHPDSAWRADGLDQTGTGNTVYHASDSLEERKDRYVDLETANAFMLGSSGANMRDGLFTDTGILASRTYVLCDVFGVGDRQLILSDGRMTTPGTPILYYRANPASRLFDPANPDDSIYNARDNAPLINLRRLADWAKPQDARRRHWFEPDYKDSGFEFFYEYIRDPKVEARPSVGGYGWPYRPDSYLLISAGADGLYGTDDDIKNFGN